MERPFKFCLGPLEIQMVGAPDPQQKTFTESPCGAYNVYASVKWVTIGSGNGLSPVRRQAIT